MTTAKEPGKKPKTLKDRKQVKRKQAGLEPIDYSEIAKENGKWFERAEVSYPGQIMVKANIDRDVVEWFQAHWPKYRTTMSKVVRGYMDRQMKPLAEHDNVDQILVVGKYDPEVVLWLKNNGADYERKIRLILRDFMQSCIEKGEPK